MRRMLMRFIEFIMWIFGNRQASIDLDLTEVVVESKQLEEMFSLAVAAVKITGSKDKRVKNKGNLKNECEEYGSILIDLMKSTNNAMFTVENPVNNDINKYTSWTLGESNREQKSRQAVYQCVFYYDIINKLVEKYRNNGGRYCNLIELCSKISQMDERTLGMFFQCCFSLVHNYRFVFVLKYFIEKEMCKFINPSLENAVSKLNGWIMAQYNDDVKYSIILRSPIIKLVVKTKFPIKAKKLIEHLGNRLGPKFPFHEVEFSDICFKSAEHPLSVLWSNAIKHVTRITFSNCVFEKMKFQLNSNIDENIMKNITKLTIKDCELKFIEANEKFLKDIEVFEICGHDHGKVLDVISNMTGLKMLVIKSEIPVEISEKISNLTNLSVLILVNENQAGMTGNQAGMTGNPVDMAKPLKSQYPHIMNSIFKFKNLEVLILDGFELYEERKRDFRLNNLKYLSMKRCSLTRFPDFLYLPSTENQSIRTTSCEVVVPWDQQMMCFPKLNFVDLSHNMIVDDLDEDSTDLPNCVSPISELYVNNNGLHQIPKWICKLNVSLKNLNLSNNSIAHIPDYFKNMNSLRTLNLSFNKIISISKDASGLNNLKELNLKNNTIISFSEVLGKYKTLKILDLSNNNIAYVSENIKNLSNLVKLDLSGNKILKFPEGLKDHSKLTSINFDSNSLENLPFWIAEFDVHLPMLEEFSVCNNKFCKKQMAEILEIAFILRSNRIAFSYF